MRGLGNAARLPSKIGMVARLEDAPLVVGQGSWFLVVFFVESYNGSM